MRAVTAKAGQSLLDVAMQHCCDAGQWHRVAAMNALEDTWVAEGGERLWVPTVGEEQVERMALEGVEPCTGKDGMEDGIGHEAVGEMMIG